MTGGASSATKNTPRPRLPMSRRDHSAAGRYEPPRSHGTIGDMRELLPDTARLDGGRLTIDGLDAAELVAAHGSPLLVYDAVTIRTRARAYREAAPDALVVYGTKAFPNVA